MTAFKRVDLPASAAAAGHARRVVATFGDLSAGVVADAQLVVSELVTNALLHAGLRPSDRILLTIRRDADALRIEVDDRAGFSGVRRRRRPGQAGGFGLEIVDALAARWEARGGRVTAWLAA